MKEIKGWRKTDEGCVYSVQTMVGGREELAE